MLLNLGKRYLHLSVKVTPVITCEKHNTRNLFGVQYIMVKLELSVEAKNLKNVAGALKVGDMTDGSACHIDSCNFAFLIISLFPSGNVRSICSGDPGCNDRRRTAACTWKDRNYKE